MTQRQYKITLTVQFTALRHDDKGGIQAAQRLWNEFCGKLAEAGIHVAGSGDQLVTAGIFDRILLTTTNTELVRQSNVQS